MKDIRNEHYRLGDDGIRNVPKIGYSSEREASKFVQSHYDNPREWSVYRCLICGKWHIGHSKRVTTEEKLKESQENVRYLKHLLEMRDEEIFKLKEQLYATT